MVSVIDKKKDGRKAITYDTGGDKPDEPPTVVEEAFEYIASCPVCMRRVFDVSDIPGDPVQVRLKCPHCRNIVKIQISKTDQIILI